MLTQASWHAGPYVWLVHWHLVVVALALETGKQSYRATPLSFSAEQGTMQTGV